MTPGASGSVTMIWLWMGMMRRRSQGMNVPV